jgi:hypothetical protein
MRGTEPPQRRLQVQLAEGDRGGDPQDSRQPPDRLAQLGRHVVELVEPVGQPRHQTLARGGQSEPPRRAVQELHAEPALQFGHVLRGELGREAKPPGGGGERSCLDRSGEDPQPVDEVQRHPLPEHHDEHHARSSPLQVARRALPEARPAARSAGLRGVARRPLDRHSRSCRMTR